MITSDELALRLAIAASPEEQTPRDMYLDYLLEHAPERAKARLKYQQVRRELARCAESPSDLTLLDELSKDERDLRAQHERKWRRTFPCAACQGTGTGEVTNAVNRSCLHCAGTGDCGGLLERSEIIANSEMMMLRKTWRHPVDLDDLGFVRGVHARLDDVFVRKEVCGRCGNRGPCHECGRISDADDYTPATPPLAWVRWHPVRDVSLTCRVPMQLLRDLGYLWFKRSHLPTASDEIPEVIWPHLGGEDIRASDYDDIETKRYPTRDLANVALSRAVATVLRAELARERA